jgi:DnaJ-domain-containing protein 1
VPDRPWDRLRRRRKDADDSGAQRDESADLNDEDYAWWAARDELETGKVPHGRKRPKQPEEPKKSGFEQYYSTESLFDWTGDSVSVLDETDPYVVLGLPSSASWEEITSAHRRLAKLHHPDRLVDATPDQRENGDRRIRELNIAYMELRRRKGR